MRSTRNLILPMAIVLWQACMVSAPPPPPPQGPPPPPASQGALHAPPPGAACVGWRQTGSCSPTGPREPGNDKGCDASIEPDWSGYCECVGGAVGASCGHPRNDCNGVCRQAFWSEAPPPQASPPGAACVGWRQTGSCAATGPREPGNDKGCDASIEPGWSGFCECVGGVVGADCSHPRHNCKEVCRRARWSEAPPPQPPPPGAACVAWRQTGGCAATGTREPYNDKGCGVSIEPGWSGFCECVVGVVGVDCGHPRWSCAQACRAGRWDR